MGACRRHLLCLIFCLLTAAFVKAADVPAHGLWVWKSPVVLAAPRSAEKLRDFCRSAGINEVYVSVSAIADASVDSRLAQLVALLHRSNIRVEALLSSNDADEPGAPREKLLRRVQQILKFNGSHSADRFDGIHLDIEPQQRPENKGSDNLQFLPGLVDAYRAVRSAADNVNLSVNADIQKKLLNGNLAQRKMLFTALQRLTLMLYELSGTSDGGTTAQKITKLRATNEKYMNMAYEGLSGSRLAKMTIALRTPDYEELLPQMLRVLDETNTQNPHYRGWAWHSYNDSLGAAH
jgi:hypothetical protein